MYEQANRNINILVGVKKPTKKNTFKTTDMKANLSKYTNKAVAQLLSFNNEFNRMLPTSNKQSLTDHLNSKYIMTNEQLTYVLSKFDK